MALNKTGNLLGTNSGNKHGLFPQYNEQESHSGVTNVHNNSNKKDIPKEVGRVFALPDVSQDRENRFGLNRENGHVRYEDLTNILGLKRMDSESFSDIGDFIAKKQPPAQEMKNGISAYILSKGQKGDNNNGDHGALRKTFSESISEQIDTRLAVLSPVYVHKRSHSNGFSSSGILEDSLSGGKMKFLCSFGGKILPRPGDGKLRYVGGETHIISIQKDISWEELMNKTLRICSHPHTIKYQLPGEDLDALISVSSDEDLQNMIEEYYELESHEGSQKLRIFLVPLGESEETSPTDANTVLQNDPDYQYVVALNGIVDHSPKKNIGGQSLTTEAYHSTTSFSFAPTIASSPKEIRDGNNSMSALNPDRILNDPVNLQSPLRISPTPVQVASSSTGYIQLLGSNSCQGSIDSNASFVTAQMNSGNSSINTADCRYPQQASVPRQHGDIGPPKNLNGQYFDNRNPNNCYSDEVFGGTLHNDRIFFSRNPISQQTESYGTKNELPHGMPHAFSDSQLYPSGAKSIYCSQEGISPSFSLNLEKAELSLTVGVSHVNLIEGQHDPFLHHPQIQSKIPNKESAEMHRRQGVASSSPYSESVGTNDRINKDSILTEKKYLVAQTDLSGSNFVEKDVLENPLKSERMMINEEKNPISKDNNVYEGNPTVNYMSELHLLDTFPTNNISANIGMQYNWDQPRENTLPSSSGTTGLSLNNLVDKTPSDLLDIGQNTSYSRNINFPARNINLNSPISEYAENSRDKSSVRDDMFNFSFDPHSLKSAQIQPSQNQIATGFHDNPTINSESSNPAVLHDDVCPSLILPVDSLDSSRNNVSFKKPPSFLNDFITNTDQMVDQFKHEYSASGLSKVEGEILGRLKNSERSNDSKLVESFAVAEDATGVVPSNRKSSPVHPPHNFDEVGSDVSPSQTEVESTIPESDPEDYKDDQTDMNDFLSDAMIAEMEASIYGLQIIRNTDLEELMELGSGTYGTVYHGKWRGTDVAIKRIKKSCFFLCITMDKSGFVDMKLESQLNLVDENKVDWKGRSALKFKYGGMKVALLILVTFGLENLGTFALAVNSVPYFNGIMHYELEDAANMLTNYMGVSYILSILVAVVADTWIGRYKSVIFSGFFEFLGLALLTAQAHYPSLQPRICNINDATAHCKTPSRGQEALLFLGLYLLAFGSAGTKAALPSHGADQFDETDPKEAKQMSTFFNTLLLAVCLGGSVSLTFIVWIQINKGWDWGFGIGTIAIFIGTIIFASGLPLYRIQVVKGTSGLIEIIQVYVAAIRNRNLPLPEDPTELYEIEQDKETAEEIEFLPHRDIFRFLDRAAINSEPDIQLEKSQAPSTSPWKLCRVTQVENAKIILSMVPIFCCTIIMTLCLAQLQTFSIEQGYTMDTSFTKHFHIPPASLPIIPIMFLIILVPIYDRIFVPVLRKFTGIPTGVTHLQRIGVGLILASVSMAVASIVEVKRKRVANDNNMLDAFPVLQPLPITTFWLSFQYFIFGIADLFTYIGLLQFFYSEAPKGLKSTSTCFLWTSMALGYFLSTIVVKCINGATKHTKSGGWLVGNNINRNHLNLFYLFLSIVSLINFFVYLFVSKRYKYRPRGPKVDADDNSK